MTFLELTKKGEPKIYPEKRANTAPIDKTNENDLQHIGIM